jgi:GTP-binding protein EngB required for normal cell division
MQGETEKIKQFVKWYEETARPFLLKTSPEEKVADFDKDIARLSKAVDSFDPELAVCFLGSSGIGKSTLINALLGGRQAVVPSGGVGPLTAQAVVVRYQESPGFEVEYHAQIRLWRTIFGLEHAFKAELGAPAASLELPAELGELEESDLPEETAPDQEAPEGELAPEQDQQRRERREELRRRAQLLITGSQDQPRELRYLLDCLREAAGERRIWGTQADPADETRIRQIKGALALAKSDGRFALNGSATREEFQRALRDHATGFLAPMIKSLTLNLQADLLKEGVTLVDLPGVGIVRDVHKDVTRRWIREKTRALVLVVDHRGLPESLAEALKRSEFLNSLLYSADEPMDDPILMVAVTRMDDVAGERYRQDKSRRKYEYFLEATEEAKTRLRSDVQRYLEETWLNDTEAATDARKQVVRNLLDKLEVHPLSAPEYAKLMADDEDDPPFLRDIDQTGVPGFARSLGALARERRDRASQRLEEQIALFHEQLSVTLRLIGAQWEAENRAEEEAARLREDLELFMQPLRIELGVRQGAYRTFLKKGAPQRIEDLVVAARHKASREIYRYLKKVGTSHWATLRASVRRGGRYSGASAINLPIEFALRFEEPVAEVWGKDILKDIRRETKEYAQDCVAIVEQVSEWALAQGARVQPKVVEAQRDAIRADAKKLENVGQGMVKEMRDEAKARLIDAIEGPIKKACEEFVRQNQDVGPGVRNRILELYENLPDKVTEAAEEPARRILVKLFKSVENEILNTFANHQNPLDSVAEAIVNSQQQHLQRSDAQMKMRVLEELREVEQSMPASSAQSGRGAPSEASRASNQ